MEERLRSKELYKIELYLLRIMPMLLAGFYLVNTILSLFAIDIPIISFIAGMSIVPLIFMYLSSYVFRFCSYHRMFLHYISFNIITEMLDYYSDILVGNNLYYVQLIGAGISLFIILYLYRKC